jgi:pimeloyl-ACP methyl ester carboxylesterase
MNSPVTESGSFDGIGFTLIRKGERPWLVLTHGAFCTMDEWQPLVSRLGECHNLMLWDLPGHGQSRRVPPVKSLVEGADVLARAMDAAGVRQAKHLGHSFGGMIAQAFVRRHPGRSIGLVAYGCVPVTKVKTPPKWLLKLAIKARFNWTPRERFAREFSSQAALQPEIQEQLVEAICAARKDLAPAIWTAMVEGSSWEPDFLPSCPIALLTGEQDDRFPGARAAMVEWGQSLPAGRWIDMPLSGHMIHREAPEPFCRAVRALLNALSRS